MASLVKQVNFKNATINLADKSITEFTRDDSKTYDLYSILTDFDNVDGISLTIKQSDDLPEKVEAEDTSVDNSESGEGS